MLLNMKGMISLIILKLKKLKLKKKQSHFFTRREITEHTYSIFEHFW